MGLEKLPQDTNTCGNFVLSVTLISGFYLIPSAYVKQVIIGISSLSKGGSFRVASFTRSTPLSGAGFFGYPDDRQYGLSHDLPIFACYFPWPGSQPGGRHPGNNAALRNRFLQPDIWFRCRSLGA